MPGALQGAAHHPTCQAAAAACRPSRGRRFGVAQETLRPSRQRGSSMAAAAKAAPAQAQQPPVAALQQQQQEHDAQPVPATWPEVWTVFFTHPSAYVPSVAIAGLACARVTSEQPLSGADAAVAAGVVVFWLLQEWVVHRWLLHSPFEWFGRTIHQQHHETPYHHVSLDPPSLILGVMLLAGALCAGLFAATPWLALTATASYYVAGLFYEFIHYVVHTRVQPPRGPAGAWLRAVRRHHTLHHMRNEGFWLSFSLPSVDRLFGTLPASGTAVPLTELARAAHGSGGGSGGKAAGVPQRQDTGVVAAAVARR